MVATGSLRNRAPRKPSSLRTGAGVLLLLAGVGAIGYGIVSRHNFVFWIVGFVAIMVCLVASIAALSTRRLYGSTKRLSTLPQARAPELVPRVTSVHTSVVKRRLQGERAAVYLVIDHSRSMSPLFKDGTIQAFAEHLLAVAANLDDDGIVPTLLFDTVAHRITEIEIGSHRSIIKKMDR